MYTYLQMYRSVCNSTHVCVFACVVHCQMHVRQTMVRDAHTVNRRLVCLCQAQKASSGTHVATVWCGCVGVCVCVYPASVPVHNGT